DRRNGRRIAARQRPTLCDVGVPGCEARPEGVVEFTLDIQRGHRDDAFTHGTHSVCTPHTAGKLHRAAGFVSFVSRSPTCPRERPFRDRKTFLPSEVRRVAAELATDEG